MFTAKTAVKLSSKSRVVMLLLVPDCNPHRNFDLSGAMDVEI